MPCMHLAMQADRVQKLTLSTARELQQSPTRPPVSSPSVAANLRFIENGDLHTSHHQLTKAH